MADRDHRGFVSRPISSRERLETDRQIAIEAFITERMKEPLQAYVAAYDRIEKLVTALLIGTVDLTRLKESAREILSSPEMISALRYVPGPPISADDLKTLVSPQALQPKALSLDDDLSRRLIETIIAGLDRKRFPWITEQRQPTDTERYAAIVATTALMATQQLATSRRNEGKAAQEMGVRNVLVVAGLKEVPARTIDTMRDVPKPGEFCGNECKLGGTKADMIVALWDNRILPIECKVSNSSVNSFKRLYHEAAGKAESWIKNFGANQVVPAAVLSGVYSLANLESAQGRGLTIFWSHRLDDLSEWIESTRP